MRSYQPQELQEWLIKLRKRRCRLFEDKKKARKESTSLLVISQIVRRKALNYHSRRLELERHEDGGSGSTLAPGRQALVKGWA